VLINQEIEGVMLHFTCFVSRDQVPVSGSKQLVVLRWREYCYKRPLLEDREDV